jgi:trichothecene 3-O-acetyltransferase
LEINRTISEVDNAWVLRNLAYFKDKECTRDTEPALGFRFGPDLYITSWLNFGADNIWNIPGTTSERPEYIRRATDRRSDGGVIILPRRRAVIDDQEAPYEILVRLASEDMQRLEEEEGGLCSWTERVVE